MLADLILNLFGEAAAKRYRALRRALSLLLLACSGLIVYAWMQGPV